MDRLMEGRMGQHETGLTIDRNILGFFFPFVPFLPIPISRNETHKMIKNQRLSLFRHLM